MYKKYSVLMPVYYKVMPSYLKESIDSIINQTLKADEIVLVCDGKLTNELNNVVFEYKSRLGKFLKVVRIRTNKGLSNALNVGLKYCKNELVARMDSDDISFCNRCEKQINIFNSRDIDIVSSTVIEFKDNINNIISTKKVPECNKDIIKYCLRRSPFNHPAVMYKKSKVIELGGYGNFDKFEDYYLWVNMLHNGCIGYNVQEPLLYMRCNDDLYHRRGGLVYIKNIYSFQKYLYKNKYQSFFNYTFNTFERILVAILPNKLRKLVYLKIIRK